MGKIVPLCMLQSGECGEVVDVSGAEHWVCRLAEKGLRLGCRLEMLAPGEPALCRVEETRLSLRTAGQVEVMVRLGR
ncbi:MAG TPA: FeoA family protein [Planctomycetia bacterium]|nr:FeoA family protein [Planctomycetia bacterium]